MPEKGTLPKCLSWKSSYAFSKENIGYYVQADYCNGLYCGRALLPSLTKSTTVVSINGFMAKVLVDSGSSESFIHPKLVESASLLVYSTISTILMATSSLETKVSGFCLVDLDLEGRLYCNLHLSVLPELCADLILGLDYQSQHKNLVFEQGSSKSSLSICGLSSLNMDPPQIYANLSDDCRLIATKSCKYSRDDSVLISSEVKSLLAEGIIEPSFRVVVFKGENRRKCMVVDYSQTINRFAQLDAFPLPRINEHVNGIVQYRVFSTIDLHSAYHQVHLRQEEKPYTPFAASGGLYQVTSGPFGVTKGVACFQCKMTDLVRKEGLTGVFPYLDDITICGKDQEEHDANLECFFEAAKRKNITYNEEKSVFSTRHLAILGSIVEEGEIRPDPESLRPLRELPVPNSTKLLNGCKDYLHTIHSGFLGSPTELNILTLAKLSHFLQKLWPLLKASRNALKSLL